MKISQMLLDQLDREVDATRRVVERVPEGSSDWKPHPKSMPMGYLSVLVAGMFGWIAMIVDRDFLEPGGGGESKEVTRAERLAVFDDSVAAARSGALDLRGHGR